MIARFFKEIGWVDELGSGVRNVLKYTSLYTEGTQPVFIEDDLFKTVIPLVTKTTQITTQKTTQKTTRKTEGRILAILRNHPKYGRIQIAKALGDITEDGVKYHLDKLRKSGKIVRIGSAKTGHWKVNDI
jgi:ATP-dependent DNA helicase RecG